MAEATIVASKVFGPRTVNTKNGPGEVYDVRTSDDQKFGVWGDLGKTIQAAEGATFKIEYTEYEKGGFVNKTIKSANLTSVGNVVPLSGNSNVIPQDARSQQINRSVAFKGAIDLLVATGIGPDPSTGAGPGLDVVFAVNELTEALLPVVDGTFSEIGTLEEGQ